MSKSFEECAEIGRSLIDQGADIEDVLQRFRQENLGILDSIRLVRMLKGTSLGEAKRIVHLSRTWADLRQENDSLHEQIMNSIEDLPGASVEPTESAEPGKPAQSE